MSVTDSTINLQANGDASLAILQGPNMHGAGRAVLRASATGSFSDPSISGYADIEGGSFRLSGAAAQLHATSSAA